MHENSLIISFTGSSGEMLEVKTGSVGEGKCHDFYFKSTDVNLTTNAEALVTTAILPCMRMGRDLDVNLPVSQTLLNSISTISDIFCLWDPTLHRASIRNCMPCSKSGSSEKRVGLFFSGGVDCFYTFLKHREEITDLILVHGFDISIDNDALRMKTSRMVREVGAEFGKRVIEVETNVRTFLDPYAEWGSLAYGAGLASVGHVLFPLFSRIYIAAAHSYDLLIPSGAHPLLDPLWSSESLEFVHDGCEATRIEKVRQIAGNDSALNHLRVCPKNSSVDYNCGQCEKCLRTMINLHIVGALERCRTFHGTLDPNHVAKMKIYGHGAKALVEENLRALQGRPQDVALCKALRKALNPAAPKPPFSMVVRIHLYKLVLMLRKLPFIYRFLKWVYDKIRVPLRGIVAKTHLILFLC